MKNAMQLKAVVKRISKEKNISAQLVLQNYMLERLLERISLSDYKQNFILKGGFLIAAIVGLDTRATMDMDLTLKGMPLNEKSIFRMFDEITGIELNDDITFELKNISEIREGDEYTGYKIALSGNYPPMEVPLKIDITTGDVITPKEIEFEYEVMLEDKRIPILAYNIETILAEKLETVVSRGDQNTRPRDFYDIYILKKLRGKNIDYDKLRIATEETAKKRGTWAILNSYKEIIKDCELSEDMEDQWKKYQSSFEYARDIEFKQTCDAVVELMERILPSSKV